MSRSIMVPPDSKTEIHRSFLRIITAAPLPLTYGHSASVSCQFSRQRNWDVLYRFGFSFFVIVPLAKVCATSSEGLIISSLVGVTDVVLFYCIASDSSTDGE